MEVKAGLEVRQDLGGYGTQQVAVGTVTTTGRSKPSKGNAPGKVQIMWQWKNPDGKLITTARWVSDDLPNLFSKGRHEEEQDYGYREIPDGGMENPVLGIEKFEESTMHKLIREEIRNNKFQLNIEFIAADWSKKDEWDEEINKLFDWVENKIDKDVSNRLKDKYLSPQEVKSMDEWGNFPMANPLFLRALLYIVLKDVKPLYTNSIKKYLGSGTFKSAFLMDNDHVLAVGRMMDNPGLGRDNWKKNTADVYQKMMTQQHDPKGGAKSTDLPIYDYGEINKGMFFVEMGKVEIPEDRFKRTGRSGIHVENMYDVLSKLSLRVYRAMQLITKNEWNEMSEEQVLEDVLANKNVQEFIAMSLPEDDTDDETVTAYFPTTEDEMMAYIRAIVRIAKRRGMQAAIDAHPKNVGFLYHDPGEMAVFDIAE